MPRFSESKVEKVYRFSLAVTGFLTTYTLSGGGKEVAVDFEPSSFITFLITLYYGLTRSLYDGFTADSVEYLRFSSLSLASLFFRLYQ